MGNILAAKKGTMLQVAEPIRVHNSLFMGSQAPILPIGKHLELLSVDDKYMLCADYTGDIFEIRNIYASSMDMIPPKNKVDK